MKVHADINKNRLYFKFNGVVTKVKTDALYTDIRFCVVDLAPGFDVVSDYSECSLLHLDCIPVLQKIMSYLMEYGLGEIVRVIKKEQISYKQILNLGIRVQGYKPIYVSAYH